MKLWWHIALVALGSALGGLGRWTISRLALVWLGKTLWGTCFVNLTGCLFLGWFLTVVNKRQDFQQLPLSIDECKLLLAVGFTGSFTTFSTFEYETQDLLRDGDGLNALTYLFGSIFFGLLAVRLGIWLGQEN